MTATQATPDPQAAGATLHLGGDAYCTPDLKPLLVPIEQLHPFPGNARRGDQDAITSSVRDLGVWRAHVAQTGTGHVVVGNHQLRALLDLGATVAPASWRDCDDDTARAIAIRDNHTSDLGTYNQDDLLALYRATDQSTGGLGLAGLTTADLTGLEAAVAASGYTPPVQTPSLADRFVVPPFTVLDQRGGAWQDRKRRWLALGIQSEVGRGDAFTAGGHSRGDAGGGLADIGLPKEERRARDDARRAAKKAKTLGAVQTNLDGEDAERYGRTDTRGSLKGMVSEKWNRDPKRVQEARRRQKSSPDQYRQIAGRSMKGQEGLTAIKPNLAGALAGQRSLGQGLQGHRDPATGELVYTETTAAGVSIFDPVLTELAYRWFSPPSGHVLDPFAGGSVRGIVAAALGRTYTGIELRPEQVQANEAQADTIVPRLGGTTAPRATPPGDYTPDLTPIEDHDGHLVKRDDLYRRAGQRGGKVRSCWELATTGDTPAAGLVTASSRHSPQAIIVAHIAEQLGIGCRIHMPSGAETDEMAACRRAGADIIQHTPGRNTVIVKRARDDATENTDWRHIPFGMETPAAVAQTATQAISLAAHPTARVVIPVGSGMSLAGVLTGMVAAGLTNPVLGVVVGADPETRLDTYAPEGWRNLVELVEADSDYDTPAPTTNLGALDLDPHYEAKCLPHLTPGDLLWVVGNRAQDQAPITHPRPRWHTGDSAQVLPTLDVAADLIFSCPPYADLEVYSDDPADLSNMPYDQFLVAYRAIIAAAVALLRDDRYAVWVIGEVRDKRGHYRGLVPDTIRAFTDAGCSFYNEAILVTPVGSLPIRAGRQFAAGRKLGKTHQNVLVFCKGDPRAAADACGTVEVSLPEVDDETL